jgi:hypothetical protein
LNIYQFFEKNKKKIDKRTIKTRPF